MTAAPDALVIGGSGLYELPLLEPVHDLELETPYGPPSAAVRLGRLGDRTIAFLARHGPDHRYLPHEINYRANIHAGHQLGAAAVIGINTVGSLDERFVPGTALFPDQLIDYTWGRAHTFAAAGQALAARHVDFTRPYDAALRQSLISAGNPGAEPVAASATLAVTQGPRLETAAEIARIAADGGHVVGMTGLPEAALARELALPMACVAIVANWAAGFRDEAPLEMDALMDNVARGTATVLDLLRRWCVRPEG